MKKLFDISEPRRLKLLARSKVLSGWVFALFRIAILLSIGYIILYPLFYMVVTSLVSGDAYKNSTRVWIPTDFNIKGNYYMAWESLEYTSAILNTLKTPILSALLEVCSCAVVGYGFARFKFRGKKFFTGLLFLTILVPDMMVILPRMVNLSSLDFLGILGLLEKLFGTQIRPNLLNTPWTFWLPSLFGVGLRSGILIYIYIQFFKGLPHELEEAAWVDGAGPIKTFLRIAIPSSGVVILTVIVFSLIWHWNDSFLTTMYFTDRSEYPLAVTLSGFGASLMNKFNIEYKYTSPASASIGMAACVLYIAPMLIFYMIVQRWFIESIDRVGITG